MRLQIEESHESLSGNKADSWPIYKSSITRGTLLLQSLRFVYHFLGWVSPHSPVTVSSQRMRPVSTIGVSRYCTCTGMKHFSFFTFSGKCLSEFCVMAKALIEWEWWYCKWAKTDMHCNGFLFVGYLARPVVSQAAVIIESGNWMIVTNWKRCEMKRPWANLIPVLAWRDWGQRNISCPAGNRTRAVDPIGIPTKRSRPRT